MDHRLKLLAVFTMTFASLAIASPSTLTYRPEVRFEENVGQFPKGVRFGGRTGQMYVYIYPTDVRIALPVRRDGLAFFDFVQIAFMGFESIARDDQVLPVRRRTASRRELVFARGVAEALRRYRSRAVRKERRDRVRCDCAPGRRPFACAVHDRSSFRCD